MTRMAPANKSVKPILDRRNTQIGGACLLQILLQGQPHCRRFGRRVVLPQLRYIHFCPFDIQAGFQILHKLVNQFLVLCVREREVVSGVEDVTGRLCAFIRDCEAMFRCRGKVIQAATENSNSVISPARIWSAVQSVGWPVTETCSL